MSHLLDYWLGERDRPGEEAGGEDVNDDNLLTEGTNLPEWDGSVYFKPWFKPLTLFSLSEMEAKAMVGFGPGTHMQYTYSLASGSSKRPNPKAYPYVYDNGIRKTYFGNWQPSTIVYYSNFVAVPEFLITCSDDHQITIQIRDMENVNTRFMRDTLSKVYTQIRNKINPKKKGWGTESGRKALLAERNKFLKTQYQKFRDKSASAQTHLEKVIEMTEPKYGPVSLERAQKIVYSKKDT